jgi:hypothetical protein
MSAVLLLTEDQQTLSEESAVLTFPLVDPGSDGVVAGRTRSHDLLNDRTNIGGIFAACSTDVTICDMAALKQAIFLTVIAVIAVIAAAIVMWLFAAFYGAFAISLGGMVPNIMTAKSFTITMSHHDQLAVCSQFEFQQSV